MHLEEREALMTMIFLKKYINLGHIYCHQLN